MRVVNLNTRDTKTGKHIRGTIVGSGVDFKGDPKLMVCLDDGTFGAWLTKACMNADIYDKQEAAKLKETQEAQVRKQRAEAEAEKKAAIEAKVRDQVEEEFAKSKQ